MKVLGGLCLLIGLAGCADIYPDPLDIQAAMSADASYNGETMPVVWDSFPDNKAMQAFYPKDAEKHSKPGVVRLMCSWNSQGRVDDCQVMVERPDDAGFGEASVAVMKQYGRVKSRDPGVPLQAGTGLQAVIQWAGGGLTLF